MRMSVGGGESVCGWRVCVNMCEREEAALRTA